MNRMNRMKWTKTLAGALLVLAVCLALVAPASAAPVMPLLFSGDVTIGGVNAPIGTHITAEIEGVQVAAATTTIVGRYVVSIDYNSGYIGKTVVLKVEGDVGGQGIYVDPMTTPLVTVNLAVAKYTLTMAVSGSGTTTPAVGAHDYTAGTVVNITATPAGGWQFGSWTGAVAAPTSATTTVTVDAAKTVTANFELIPATQKLIGADNAAGANELTGYIRLSRWQAVATGNMTEFRCKAGASGNIKVALYADSAGQPGALITAMNTAQAVVSGWNTLSFTSTAITSGTYYWLAIVFDTQGCCQAVTTTGVQYRSKAATYSGFSFPNPAGSGFDSYTTFYDLAAGWGSIVAPVPPAVPTRNCSILTFRWNASAGATNYHLQVNTSADFTGTDMSDVDVGNVTSREVTGLTGGTTYYWRVKAGNAAGWSGWSTPTGSMRCE